MNDAQQHEGRAPAPAALPSGPADARPHVVVIGGGFAGLEATRTLARAPVRVTLLDVRNHHLFQPLLYQVATAGLSPGDIAAPIRKVLARQANARVLLARAREIEPERREVVLEDGQRMTYDFLIVATGATHSYFGRDEWAKHAPGLKTVEDALEIRRRILLAFERAERCEDGAAREALLTFVVIGAGPTGVELAGALIELSRHTLAREYRAIDPRRARIVICEAQDRVLPTFPPELSQRAQRMLEDLDVDLRLGQRVTAVDGEGVTLGERERLRARTVLWAAGVAASPLARSLQAPLDRAGRVLVEPDLSVPGRPEVFVVGDLAVAKRPDGQPVPGMAPAALQMGRHAATVIRAQLKEEPRPAFRYRDKGELATIGRARAVARLGRRMFGGYFAWLLWAVVHVFFLIGFRNRLLVTLQWIWAYLTYQRGARLITERIDEPLRSPSDTGPAALSHAREGEGPASDRQVRADAVAR